MRNTGIVCKHKEREMSCHQEVEEWRLIRKYLREYLLWAWRFTVPIPLKYLWPLQWAALSVGSTQLSASPGIATSPKLVPFHVWPASNNWSRRKYKNLAVTHETTLMGHYGSRFPVESTDPVKPASQLHHLPNAASFLSLPYISILKIP